MPPDQPSHAGVGTSFAAFTLTLAAPAAIHPALAATPCDESAEVFLDGAPYQEIESSLTLHLVGSGGGQHMSFASGTNLSAAAAAINSIAQTLGVRAEQSSVNPQRLRMYSIMGGADAFVSVQQIGGDEPYLFTLSEGGQAQWMLIAHGEDGIFGDANCDARVDVVDLMSVIDHWGACPKPPSPCVGDVDLSGAVDVDDLIAVIANWT